MANDINNSNWEYDPVKELKGGVEASRVVWSTKSLEMAVDALSKGLPLKANPFCGTNTKLLKPNLVYKRTAEEMEDIIRCVKDPIYFASKCFLMTPEGLQPVTLRDYQEDYLRHLQNNRFSIFLSCRQSGKTLLIDSQIVIKLINENISDQFVRLLEKYYYYIDNDGNYILTIPLFELYNIYSKGIVNKCRYYLYKLIFKLKYGRQERSKDIR